MSLATVEPGTDGQPEELPAPTDPTAPAAPTKDVPARQELEPYGLAEKLSIASSACSVIALVCAWMLLQFLVLGGLAHARSQHLLYAEFRSDLAQATAPTGALDYNGKPVAPGRRSRC